MKTDVVTRSDEQAEAKNVRSRLNLYRLTVDQFSLMIDSGVFPKDAHVELLGGMLIGTRHRVHEMTTNEPHIFTVEKLGDWLRGIAVSFNWVVREEKPFRLSQFSRPEPDLCLVRGTRDDYRTRLPIPGDVGLVIEVSDTTYDTDRNEKWRRYAAAGIPLYWIVNLSLRRVEVYQRPFGKGRAAAYRESTVYDEPMNVSLVIEDQDLGRIAVRDLLP